MFGGFSYSYQSYSYAAAQTILPHIIGLDLYSTLEEHTSWNELAKECELIVMFGGMNLKNSKVSSGGVSKHNVEAGMKILKESKINYTGAETLEDAANKAVKILKKIENK